MDKWVFINDAFVPADSACLPVNDLAIQRGYGIFDFIKVVDDTPVFIDDHLQRFYRSATAMHLPVTYNQAELSHIIQQLALRNAERLSGVRIILTGGCSPDGYSIGTPNLIVTQNPFSPPSNGLLKRGLHLITREHKRQLSHVKTIDYLMPIWLQPDITDCGADDVLYVTNNLVTECPRANFFIVTESGSLVTPSTDVLYGITRSKVLQLAAELCPVEERAITLEDLYAATEIFITSTTKGILPVCKVDDTKYQQARPITNTLSKLLDNLYYNYKKAAETR